MKKYAVSLIVTLLTAALLYYLFLPALNVQSGGFWMYLFVVLLVFLMIFAVWTEAENSAAKGKKSQKAQKAQKGHKADNMVMGISGGLIVVVLAVMLIGAIASHKVFHAKTYANMITVENAVFAEDMEEATSVSNIALMDTQSATIIGNRTLGALSEVVSQYEISGTYSQINYQNTPQKVASLEYASFFKWLNNKSKGIPGYVMVDPVKNTANYVKLETPVKYTESACFGEDLNRKLRFDYPDKIFESWYFEIDDQGNPYYVVSCVESHAGLFGARDVSEVILFNPCDGTSQVYAPDEVPSWVDIVYTGDMASEKYNWYGTLKNGYWNSVFGNVDCKQTTDDYGYITIDDDVWYFTGVTSVSGDESNIGFIISNARTGEYKFYQVAGAEEYSAMSAAEGEVQEKGYIASFPSLINVSGQATYIMVLKDDGGLVKLYALVNVENYGIVATGSTQTEALKSYKKLLQSQGVASNTVTGDALEADITVKDVRLVEMDGVPVVYVTAETGEVYKGYLNIDESLILIQAGDRLQIQYVETEVQHIFQIEGWE